MSAQRRRQPEDGKHQDPHGSKEGGTSSHRSTCPLTAPSLPIPSSVPAHRRGQGHLAPRSKATSQCHMTQDTDTSLMGTDPRTSVTLTTQGLPCSVGGQAGTFQGRGSTASCSTPTGFPVTKTPTGTVLEKKKKKKAGRGTIFHSFWESALQLQNLGLQHRRPEHKFAFQQQSLR